MRVATIALLLFAAPLARQEPPISIARHWMEVVEPDYEIERYTPQVRLTLRIRNDTRETIVGWGATAVFLGPSGDELFRTRLTHGKADIPPGRTRDAVFRWQDSPFFDDQPFDKLAGYDADQVTILLEEVRVDLDGGSSKSRVSDSNR